MKSREIGLMLIGLVLVSGIGLFSCGVFDRENSQTPTEPSVNGDDLTSPSSKSIAHLINCFTGEGNSAGFGVYVGNGFFQVNVPQAGEWAIDYMVGYTERAIQEGLQKTPRIYPSGWPVSDEVSQADLERMWRAWRRPFTMVIRTIGAGLVTLGVMPEHAIVNLAVIPVNILPEVTKSSGEHLGGSTVEVFGWNPGNGLSVPLNQLLPQDQVQNIGALNNSFYQYPSDNIPITSATELGGISLIEKGVIVPSSPDAPLITVPTPQPWGGSGASRTIRALN